jgi:hypothetical protein
MAESKRSKQRDVFRQQLAQTWDDAQVQHRESSSERWEGERVFEVKPASSPIELPPSTSPGPDSSLKRLKVRHPVLEMVRAAVRRDGFTHPEAGNFIMLPKEFGAIITLETKAVLQVVYHIMCETVGWADPDGRAGRREWIQLGHGDFTAICGSKSQGDAGIKQALQRGYIIRRPCGNSYEYSIRWSDKKEGTR